MQETAYPPPPGPGWDHFTTKGFRPRDGLRRWTEWGQSAFGGLQVSPRDLTDFAGRAARMPLGPAVLSVMTFSPAQALKRRPETAVGADDAIIFSLPRAGRFTYISGDDLPIAVNVGDIFIRDLAHPWSASAAGDSDLITLRLPYQEFAARYGDPQHLAGRHAATRPEVACVGSILQTALTFLQSDPAEAQRDILARSVLDALGMLKPTERVQVTATESLHRAAVLYVARHLPDPELSPTMVARQMGVSPRRLQRAFHARGTTLQGTILDMRLSRAAEALCCWRGAVGITDLAMSLGFNDTAYFTRAFARRFGHPPSRHGTAAQ
ncbi:helix-turn-helix domain-containing protein [Oceanicola sp. S124]|uniref:helix-turn-helix domain-containing protein n=1 Tax=Oceanicola sp. S124 TaxID=1042378 RepID=UPI0002558266|nr:helix-turn-helix domain-containing protein [Oceanicola sp. S124]